MDWTPEMSADARQQQLNQIRHDLNNLCFVQDDMHFPKAVRDAVKRRIAELEKRRNVIYESQFHINLTPGDLSD